MSIVEADRFERKGLIDHNIDVFKSSLTEVFSAGSRFGSAAAAPGAAGAGAAGAGAGAGGGGHLGSHGAGAPTTGAGAGHGGAPSPAAADDAAEDAYRHIDVTASSYVSDIGDRFPASHSPR